MTTTINEVQYTGQTLSGGTLVDGKWQYTVTLSTRPIPSDALTQQLLRVAGWRADYSVVLEYDAGPDDAEPPIQQVGTDAMTWVITTIAAARQQWAGRTLTLGVTAP